MPITPGKFSTLLCPNPVTVRAAAMVEDFSPEMPI